MANTWRLRVSTSWARRASRTWLGGAANSCCKRSSWVCNCTPPVATLGASTTALKPVPRSSAATIKGASMRAGASTHSCRAKYSSRCGWLVYMMRALSKPGAALGTCTSSTGDAPASAGAGADRDMFRATSAGPGTACNVKKAGCGLAAGHSEPQPVRARPNIGNISMPIVCRQHCRVLAGLKVGVLIIAVLV